AVKRAEAESRKNTRLMTAMLTARPCRNDLGYVPHIRFNAFSITVNIHDVAQSITITQLRMIPVEICEIDSRFLLTKVEAPGRKASTWPMTYFCTVAWPSSRLPIESKRTSVGKYETAAAAVVRSLSMNDMKLRVSIL